MGFKFSLKKSSSADVTEKVGQRTPLPQARTSLNQSNPDWSEKTASLWSDHTNFLEQTKVSGIAPPVRGGTITGLIAAEKQRSQKSRKLATLGMALIIPLTAGGVFFYLANHESAETEQASIDEVPPPKVMKNPAKAQKNPAKDPNAQSPVTQATAAPVNIGDLPVIKEQPYSLGAVDSSYKLPNEKTLKPIIAISTSPPAAGDLDAVPKGYPPIAYTREEISSLTKIVLRDSSAKAIADKWNTTARSVVGVGVHPVAQFRFGTPQERAASAMAREDLKTLTAIIGSHLAFGEQDLGEVARQHILAWPSVYKPLGDAYSDAELVPLLRAFGEVWWRLTPEEYAQTEAWLKAVADRQITEAIQRKKRDDRWYAYHLHFVNLVAFATGSAPLQNYVKRELPVHLAAAIQSDGSTTTLAQTGSMALHLDHVNKLLEMAISQHRSLRAPTEFLPVNNNSLGLAVAFSAPYAIGLKGWTEFEKASDPTIAKRQSAGDVSVAPKAFDWRADVSFLETLAYFRLPPKISSVAASLSSSSGTLYPTPRTLLIEMMIRDTRPFAAPVVPGPMPASTK